MSLVFNDLVSEIFYGIVLVFEFEIKVVVWMLDQYKNIIWFMDFYLYGFSILYVWGDDDVQIIILIQNFVNFSFDGKCGFIGIDLSNVQYKEYFIVSDFQIEKIVINVMIQLMFIFGGVLYMNYFVVGFYVIFGVLNDYVMG